MQGTTDSSKKVYRPVNIFRPSYTIVINGFCQNCERNPHRSKLSWDGERGAYNITIGSSCPRPFEEIKRDVESVRDKKIILDFSFMVIDDTYLEELSNLSVYGIDLTHALLGRNAFSYISNYEYLNISGLHDIFYWSVDFSQLNATTIICNDGWPSISGVRPNQRIDITHSDLSDQPISRYPNFMTHNYNQNCFSCVLEEETRAVKSIKKEVYSNPFIHSIIRQLAPCTLRGSPTECIQPYDEEDDPWTEQQEKEYLMNNPNVLLETRTSNYIKIMMDRGTMQIEGNPTFEELEYKLSKIIYG